MKDKRFLKSRMEVLWNPRRVVMIGATNKLYKWGFIIFSRMLNEGFSGEIIPVHPSDKEVLGKKAFKSILEVPGEVDLAIIVTPAPAVAGVLKQCAKKGVPATVVITSGFSETGEEGKKLEAHIVDIARKAGMIMVGPNTMGTFSAARSFNCLMAPVSPLYGGAACIAQSGNVGTHMLFRGKLRGLGFGKFVSSGNEGDLTFEDYLWYFGRDPDTTSVLGYLEGLEADSDFPEIAREVTIEKPVIVLKGGRTGAGAIAASSHTGALAGNMSVVRGAMRQAGVILAESNKEVVELARALELQPVPKGPRTGILTRGGGWGVITSDACTELGLTVTSLDPATIEKLDRILPPYWSRGNPVDMVALISYQAYIDCLEILEADPNVDAIIGLGANIDAQAMTTVKSLEKLGVMSEERIREISERTREESERFFASLKDFLAGSKKPVLSVGRWRETPDWEAGIMMIAEPEDAARMMAKMVGYGSYLQAKGVLEGAGNAAPLRKEASE